MKIKKRERERGRVGRKGAYVIEGQFVLEQRPQREVVRAVDLGQGRGEIGEDAVGAEGGDDEARVAERRLGPAPGDVDVGDLALGTLAGRTSFRRVGKAAEAETRLELSDEGRPDEGAYVLEPAVHGYR